LLAVPPPRLTGWKEIAGYLNRGVRTAQRWEREFGLPVRRIGRDRSESVFAFTAEVNAWLTSASAARAHGQPHLDFEQDHSEYPGHGSTAGPARAPHRATGATPPSRLRLWLGALVTTVVVLAAVGVVAWLSVVAAATHGGSSNG